MARGQYNVGIIGYGLSAKTFHIPFVSAVPDFNLYAVVQRSPKPDDDASKDHPDIKLYRSAEDMVKDDQVHIVVVTTAPESHLQLAKLALLAKKHGMQILPPPSQDMLTVCLQSLLRNHSHPHRPKHRNWSIWPNLKRESLPCTRIGDGIRIS